MGLIAALIINNILPEENILLKRRRVFIMVNKFKRIVIIIIPILAIIIITLKLTGFSFLLSNENDADQYISIESVEPLYEVDTKDQQEKVELDRAPVEGSEMNAGESEPIVDNGTDKLLEVAGANEDGFKFGDNWTEMPPGMTPIDGNTVLDSGFKIGDVKIAILELEETLREEGLSDKEIEDDIIETIKNFGTTIEDLQRVQVDGEKTEEKEPSSNQNSGGSNKGNSGTTGGNKGNSGSKDTGNSGGSKDTNKGNSGNSGSSSSKDSGGKKEEDIHYSKEMDDWINGKLEENSGPSEYDGGDTGTLN